jgi:glucokinase
MAGLLAGVDLGGTSIKAALADESGRVLARDVIPKESHQGPDGVLARIADLIQRLRSNIANESPQAQLLGLGMGVPGLVDVQTGTTKFLPNLPTQWRDVPAAATLSERLGSPVRLLNDVRTATLGELRFGHGRNQPRMTLAFFSIGTGVGGGVAIDGQLRLGPLGAAGELGHQTLMADGPRCGCGNRGCLEALASGPAIVAEGVRLMRTGLAPQLHHLVAGQSDRVTPREMLVAADAGDELVREALQRAATWIGIAAANVVTVLHPDLVVLGGGVAELGDLLTSTVQDVIRDRVRMFPTDAVQVVRSQLGDSAGLIGEIALAQTPLLTQRTTT